MTKYFRLVSASVELALQLGMFVGWQVKISASRSVSVLATLEETKRNAAISASRGLYNQYVGDRAQEGPLAFFFSGETTPQFLEACFLAINTSLPQLSIISCAESRTVIRPAGKDP